MRVHLVALPHAHVTPDVTVCAFTQKIRKATKMFPLAGIETILYAGADSEVDCELVPIYGNREQIEWYGDYDQNTLPIVAGAWSGEQPAYQVTNKRAIREIRKRADPRDLVLITGGLAQRSIWEALPNITVEWAAGYQGAIFSDPRVRNHAPFVCFESHAWRHYLYGKWGIEDGRWFDTVIPNFFDPTEWMLWPKEDYLVFVGRMIQRKGPHIAAEIARELGKTIVFAGSGVESSSEGLIRCMDGTRLEGDVHYVGCVGWEQRNELMGSARCLLAPTTYIEPFGAVVVEAMLCGTPSVATDWGAFSELLPPERRFRTLAQGCAVVERALRSSRPAVTQKKALERWSLKAVVPEYLRWFEELSSLWGDGWYEGTSLSQSTIAPSTTSSKAPPSKQSSKSESPASSAPSKSRSGTTSRTSSSGRQPPTSSSSRRVRGRTPPSP